jgi:glucose uptake protein GlcU
MKNKTKEQLYTEMWYDKGKKKIKKKKINLKLIEGLLLGIGAVGLFMTSSHINDALEYKIAFYLSLIMVICALCLGIYSSFKERKKK